jgi:hypothetical protein
MLTPGLVAAANCAANFKICRDSRVDGVPTLYVAIPRKLFGAAAGDSNAEGRLLPPWATTQARPPPPAGADASMGIVDSNPWLEVVEVPPADFRPPTAEIARDPAKALQHVSTGVAKVVSTVLAKRRGDGVRTKEQIRRDEAALVVQMERCRGVARRLAAKKAALIASVPDDAKDGNMPPPPIDAHAHPAVADLAGALYIALLHDVALAVPMDRARFRTLVQFLELVDVALPFLGAGAVLDGLSGASPRLRHGAAQFDLVDPKASFDEKRWDSFLQSSIVGVKFADAKELENKDGTAKRKVLFLSCRGSRAALRGYTCGLWTLFHSLTVAADLAPKGRKGSLVGTALTSVIALQRLRAWVVTFFMCEDCRRHFSQFPFPFEIEAAPGGALSGSRPSWPSDVARSNENGLLWLWAAHNQVNIRLAASSPTTNDPVFPKALFPSPALCPGCFSNATAALESFAGSSGDEPAPIADNDYDEKDDGPENANTASGAPDGLLIDLFARSKRGSKRVEAAVDILGPPEALVPRDVSFISHLFNHSASARRAAVGWNMAAVLAFLRRFYHPNAILERNAVWWVRVEQKAAATLLDKHRAEDGQQPATPKTPPSGVALIDATASTSTMQTEAPDDGGRAMEKPPKVPDVGLDSAGVVTKVADGSREQDVAERHAPTSRTAGDGLVVLAPVIFAGLVLLYALARALRIVPRRVRRDPFALYSAAAKAMRGGRGV